MSLTKGRHNEKLCRVLIDGGTFYDWAIIAAFYAAMHYVYYKIFPYKPQAYEFRNFNAYFSNIRRSKTASKHSITKDLVLDLFPSASSYFNWLHDSSRIRYSENMATKEEAEYALEILKKFKEEIDI